MHNITCTRANIFDRTRNLVIKLEPFVTNSLNRGQFFRSERSVHDICKRAIMILFDDIQTCIDKVIYVIQSHAGDI
jgi:hypothetical protein